jgi:hypothetical protein
MGFQPVLPVQRGSMGFQPVLSRSRLARVITSLQAKSHVGRFEDRLYF